MKTLNKILLLGTVEEYDNHNRKVAAKVFVKVEYRDERLNMTGVVGPTRDGNCLGSCGQIDMSLSSWEQYSQITSAEGWGIPMYARLFDIWGRYHLNDLQAGTPRQMEFLRDCKVAPYDEQCVRLEAAGLLYDKGYCYGSGWLAMEVPDEILEELEAFPDSPVAPAWI